MFIMICQTMSVDIFFILIYSHRYIIEINDIFFKIKKIHTG